MMAEDAENRKMGNGTGGSVQGLRPPPGDAGKPSEQPGASGLRAPPRPVHAHPTPRRLACPQSQIAARMRGRLDLTEREVEGGDVQTREAVAPPPEAGTAVAALGGDEYEIQVLLSTRSPCPSPASIVSH